MPDFESDAPDPLVASSQALRRTRFISAIMASGLSKSLGLIIQILALPIALAALGTDRYATYLALCGVLSWTSLLTLGLIPTLPRFLAAAHRSGDRKHETEIAGASLLFTFGVAAVLILILELLPFAVSPGRLVGHGATVTTDEISAAFRVIAILVPMQVAVSVMPAIRSGFQELHISYVWSALANIFVLAGLLAIRHAHPSIGEFFCIVFGPLVFFMCCDVVLLVSQRPYLRKTHFSLRPAFELLGPVALNGMGMQISYFFLSYLPVVWLSHFTSARETAAFGSIMQILITGAAAMTLIYQPLVQGVANAHAHGDLAWLQRTYVRTLLLIGGISIAFFLVLGFGGPWLATLWLRHDLGVSNTLCALLGVYFAVLMSSMFHFYVLSGIGDLRGVGLIYLVEGIVATVLGFILMGPYGANGVAAALIVAVICCSGWYLPTKVWRDLKISFAKFAR